MNKPNDNIYTKESLRNIRLFICTPAYGYSCDIRYLQCLLDTKDFLTSKGIEVEINFPYNQKSYFFSKRFLTLALKLSEFLQLSAFS